MLSVMTLNLNYYEGKHGPWPARRELIVKVLEKHRPDIVAFQAVRKDPDIEKGADQAEQIQERLPDYNDLLFQPAQYDPDGSMAGSAVLARLPIAKRDYLELSLRPNLEDTNQRMVVHARIDLPDGPLHVFNAHFSWVEEQARDNLNEAIPYINRFAGRGVLVGDFNIPSGSRLLQMLREAGWTDAWEYLHPGMEGYTFEAGDPSRRIDYIWVNEELKTSLRSIQIVSRASEEPEARLSDHFGLLASFDLEKGRSE